MKNVENDKACWITPGDGNIGERIRARVKSIGNNVTLIFHALQGSHGERKATHKCEGWDKNMRGKGIDDGELLKDDDIPAELNEWCPKLCPHDDRFFHAHLVQTDWVIHLQKSCNNQRRSFGGLLEPWSSSCPNSLVIFIAPELLIFLARSIAVPSVFSLILLVSPCMCCDFFPLKKQSSFVFVDLFCYLFVLKLFVRFPACVFFMSKLYKSWWTWLACSRQMEGSMLAPGSRCCLTILSRNCWDQPREQRFLWTGNFRCSRLELQQEEW